MVPQVFKCIVSDLSTAWMMATMAVCVGFAINQFRDTPLALVYSPKAERVLQAVTKISLETDASNQTSPKDDASPGEGLEVRFLDLAAFREIAESGSPAIVLDARPEIFHRLGHVPHAISLPREDFEESYNKQRTLLEKDKSRPIAVYCSNSSCEDSQMVADALIKLAYKRVYVFKGGWSDWTGARLPEEKTP